jgi:hypothetical protein
MKIEGFDWDDGNREKCQKHGVPVEEVEALLRRAPRVAPDPRHSSVEARFIAVGRTSVGRPVFVAFTFRTKDGRRYLRPISARYMHRQEIARYEEEEGA